MTNPFDNHKDALAELAQKEPDILLTTISASLAALAVQHNALAIDWLDRIDDAIGCDCNSCQETIKRGMASLRLIESDGTRIQAALDLVLQVKRYRKPDTEMIKKALKESYADFQRDMLERTLKREGKAE